MNDVEGSGVCGCNHQGPRMTLTSPLILRACGLICFVSSICLNVILWVKSGGGALIPQQHPGIGVAANDVADVSTPGLGDSSTSRTTSKDQNILSAEKAHVSGKPIMDIGFGGSGISKVGRRVDVEDWRKAYEVSLDRFQKRVADAQRSGTAFVTAADLRRLKRVDLDKDQFDYAYEEKRTPLIFLMRVPKAASTHLSITGRILAGCKDPGFPCCIKKHDGEMCPKEGLHCSLVKNCVGHGSLKEDSAGMVKITQLRNPAERLLSGFFYYESVHNKNHKGCTSWKCFEAYLSDPRVRNGPIIKLLNGRYMYHPHMVKHSEVLIAQQKLCGFAWFGMNDMPLASKLLLYELAPFDHLEPHPAVFDLPPAVLQTHNMRKNVNTTYSSFIEGEYKKRRGLELIVSLNEFEFEIYAFAWGLFCARIRESGLLHYVDEFASPHFDECQKEKYNIPTHRYCPQ